MSDRTGIEWSDATWNPVTGCTEVSPGCNACYAKTFAERWRGKEGHYYQNGFDLQLRPEKLDQPLRWRRPRRIFVNSMSDLFHDGVPGDYIINVFVVMAMASRHTFQVLTKRHGRMRSLLSAEGFYDEVLARLSILSYPDVHHVRWPLPNVWLGVSAENQQWADIRIPALLGTPAAVRFISAEPLLGPINLHAGWLSPPVTLQAATTVEDRARLAQFCREQAIKAGGWTPFLDWVIVGGESGRTPRPMHPQWARSLRDQCQAAGVAYLFKQWGEWAPAPWKLERLPGEFTLDYKNRSDAAGATHAFTGGMYPQDGALVENFMKLDHAAWSIERDDTTPPGAQGMRRAGKKNAGRELDGCTWDEYPETVANA